MTRKEWNESSEAANEMALAIGTQWDFNLTLVSKDYVTAAIFRTKKEAKDNHQKVTEILKKWLEDESYDEKIGYYYDDRLITFYVREDCKDEDDGLVDAFIEATGYINEYMRYNNYFKI